MAGKFLGRQYPIGIGVQYDPQEFRVTAILAKLHRVLDGAKGMSDGQENPILCVPVGFMSVTTYFMNFDDV